MSCDLEIQQKNIMKMKRTVMLREKVGWGYGNIRFCLLLLAVILTQKAYLRKSVVLPSTLTLQLDELGDEYEDSAELMASISIRVK